MEIQRKIAIIKAELNRLKHKINAYKSVLKELEKEFDKKNNNNKN